MEKRTRFNLLYLVFALLGAMLLQSWWQTSQTVEIVPYSEFEALLAQGRFAEVTVGDRLITGRLQTPQGSKTTLAAERVEPDVAERLSRYGVPYTRVHEPAILRDILSWVVPALVFFGIWSL